MSADQVITIRTGDERIKRIALGIAILVHAAVLFIPFPEVETIVPEKTRHVIEIRHQPLRPPPVEPPREQQLDLRRQIYVPDLTPDEPEPIREPEIEIHPEPSPADVPFITGDPPKPPSSGPLFVDGDRVTAPVRIEESAVKPVYPEIARMIRAEGRVIIRAVILEDGTVADLEILDCDRPGVEFEEAAIEAVKQLLYRPAMQGDRPVDVYFTVVVQFELS